MFHLWWNKGRDPRLRPIAAQYEPPDQLSPGEVGTLIDNSVDMRDITASIVDLAVRGYLVIEEKKVDHLLGLTHSTEYRLPSEEISRGVDCSQTSRTATLEWHLHRRQCWRCRFSLRAPQPLLHQTFPPSKTPFSVRSLAEVTTPSAQTACGPTTFFSASSLASSSSGAATARLQIWAWLRCLLSLRAFSPVIIICGFGWFMSARTQTGRASPGRDLGL